MNAEEVKSKPENRHLDVPLTLASLVLLAAIEVSGPWDPDRAPPMPEGLADDQGATGLRGQDLVEPRSLLAPDQRQNLPDE
jgi:hypothetical protein